MWARIIQLMLALWLVISPFILNSSEFGKDFFFGGMIAFFALLGCYKRIEIFANTVSFILGALLFSFAYFSTKGLLPPVEQNREIVGILVLMFSIIPLDSLNPPLKLQPKIDKLMQERASEFREKHENLDKLYLLR